jgi:ATP-dependent helicase/nuclease subunit A
VALASTVCPGRHVMGDAGGYDVVWWDPRALVLGVPAPFGVRRDDLIVKDVARGVVADGRSRYDRWKLARQEARDGGSVPSMAFDTAGRWAAGNAAIEGSGDVIIVDAAVADAARTPGVSGAVNPPGSHGRAFGLLVHAVLGQAPLHASREVVEQHAAAEARLLGLGDDEIRAAADRIVRVLAHDLLVRARAAAERGACRRETPVSWVLPDGMLIEGVVDLAFEDADGWTVVDYKTDRELAGGAERYRRQIALYARSIAQATGRPAAGVLVRV